MTLTQLWIMTAEGDYDNATFPDTREGLAEAKEYAEKIGAAVLCAEFEYSDSYPVTGADFREGQG